MLGSSQPRIDAPQKVRGRAQFTGDKSVAGLLHARIVGAPVASGTLRSVDAGVALAQPDVVAAFTTGDFGSLTPPVIGALGARPQPGAAAQSWLPLTDNTIRHHGQPVAIVVAETRQDARAAAKLVEIDIQPTPASVVFNPSDASSPYRDEIGMRPNELTRGSPDQAFSGSDITLQRDYDQAAQAHMPLERHVTLAQWIDGRLIIDEPSQWVLGVRMALSQALQMPENQIDVRSENFGGGFGGKCFVWPHTIFAAEIARQLGRPVQLELERDQVAALAGHRTPSSHTIKLAAQADGKLTAIEHICVSRGTQEAEDERIQPAYGGLSRMLYACPSVRTVQTIARTNTPPPAIMRGPAQGPASFALESALDELATETETDPIALRIRNHADTDPEHERLWSSKHLLDCYSLGAKSFGWNEWAAEPRAHLRDGLLHGRGMATASYYGIRQPSHAGVQLTANGEAMGSAATHDLGTGARTIFAQVIADRLGLPFEQCGFNLGRSALPASGLTGISMTTASVSSAIVAACDQLISTIERLRNPDEAALSPAQVLAARGIPQLSAEAATSPSGQSEDVSRYVFGAVFVEVAVNPRTGEVRPQRVHGVYDYGRVLNGATADAQLKGGIIQGLGMALWEELFEDPETGAIQNPGFGNYHVPTFTDLPEIKTISLDRPDPHAGAVGAKGCGEIGFIGVAAAVANAVFHATGKRVRRVPIRPSDVRET
ncbi:MAG: xanthine dehydrogenase family protein molybdopterin-binding subunit [Pseudomonadota bacterium]